MTKNFALQTFNVNKQFDSFYRDWNPRMFQKGGTYDLWAPMKEISLTDEVDILANIEDLSWEIMNDSVSKNKRQTKTKEIHLEFEEPPVEVNEFHLSWIDLVSDLDKSIKQEQIDEWFDKGQEVNFSKPTTMVAKSTESVSIHLEQAIFKQSQPS